MLRGMRLLRRSAVFLALVLGFVVQAARMPAAERPIARLRGN